MAGLLVSPSGTLAQSKSKGMRMNHPDKKLHKTRPKSHRSYANADRMAKPLHKVKHKTRRNKRKQARRIADYSGDVWMSSLRRRSSFQQSGRKFKGGYSIAKLRARNRSIQRSISNFRGHSSRRGAYRQKGRGMALFRGDLFRKRGPNMNRKIARYSGGRIRNSYRKKQWKLRLFMRAPKRYSPDTLEKPNHLKKKKPKLKYDSREGKIWETEER
ncbi:hypothetical protein AAG747_10720 [Rapidithrix thailandica]|uniref:Uncharacterized protein n=1 Tax=Rapidithrix thailandica TaxID=413964 RepID=A0AAW9S7J6_9BACT